MKQSIIIFSGLLFLLALIPDSSAETAEKTCTPVPPGERLVGMAYTTWHRPETWGNVWSTPLLGTYSASERTVIRQHAGWLAEAGVDFIWIDWSNNVNYFPEETRNRPDFEMIESSTTAIFDEYAKLEKHPQISIFLGVSGAPEAVKDGRLQRKADQVYRDYVSPPEYGRLIQRYLGKPLLVVYTDTPSPWQQGTPEWNDDRFTVRWMTGFVTEQKALRTEDLVSRYGYWSWEDRGPQTYTIFKDHPEAMVIVAAWRQQAEPGQPGYIPARGRRNGDTFREEWKRARAIGPKFAMVVSWNEWTRGEQPSVEISKDIEPSREFGAFYLDLLKEEIARFKSGK